MLFDFRKRDVGQLLSAHVQERRAREAHQVLETAALIVADAGIDQRYRIGEKLRHAFLLAEVVNYRRVLAGQRLELVFPARVREAASVEHKAAAIARIVGR